MTDEEIINFATKTENWKKKSWSNGKDRLIFARYGREPKDKQIIIIFPKKGLIISELYHPIYGWTKLSRSFIDDITLKRLIVNPRAHRFINEKNNNRIDTGCRFSRNTNSKRTATNRSK